MRFSNTEKIHLLKAWLAISLAFAILLVDDYSQFFIFLLISLLTAGIGFLFHELAHKFVAQRYGCWAEFRADDRMLIFAIISSFIGFVFAAPGAVFIHGNVTIEKNGKISLAGPLTNVILGAVFLAMSLTLPLTGIALATISYGYRINSFIGLFNMIPFLNFDGEKILRWNKKIYFFIVAVSAVLFLLPWLPVF